MSLSPETQRLSQEALELARNEHWDGAMRAYRQLLAQLHHPDVIYDDWVRILADIGLRSGQPAVAGIGLEYLLEHERAYQAYQQARRFEAAARCRARAGDHAGAAQAYEAIGAFARAGQAWEAAGDAARAVRAWERSAQRYSASEDRYRTALSLLNLGLAQLDAGEARGRSTLSRAIVLLEEEADTAEGNQDPHRALACFHALIHIGRKTASHENLAEGFINCIRLMQRRDHRFFVLQYFHDFAEASLQVAEHQAAAEALREGSEFCRRTGMLYGNHFLARAAEAFEGASRAHLESGAPPELSENALLAALDCHNRLGDVRKVKITYERIAALPLPEARRSRYLRLAEGASGVGVEADGWPFRGYFAEEAAYPPTWRDDLTDADAGTSILSPVPESVGNLRLWDVVRRRCLLIVLQSELPTFSLDSPSHQEELVPALGRLGAPVALPPLERVFVSAQPRARASVAATLRFLPFRESIELAGRCLADPSEAVREAAIGALRYLVFPGAFAPLVRLFRDHTDLEVRRQVILALGRLVGMEHNTSKDALDFLLHALREGVDPLLVEDLRVAIAANANDKSLVTLERHMLAEAEGEVRDFLEKVTVRIETRRISATLGVG